MQLNMGPTWAHSVSYNFKPNKWPDMVDRSWADQFDMDVSLMRRECIIVPIIFCEKANLIIKAIVVIKQSR